MFSKTIANDACLARAENEFFTHSARRKRCGARRCSSLPWNGSLPRNERGATLVELMVGLTIGLMVIAAAMGALMLSRGISGTVSDASGLQQQAAYAFRVLGEQIRQAGSLYLNPDPASSGAGSDPLNPAAFETDAQGQNKGNSFSQDDTINAKQPASDTIGTAFRRYKDTVFAKGGVAEMALARNCIGAPGDSSTDEKIESNFQLKDGQLQCGGNGATTQPIAQNVAQFQVRYMVQADPISASSTVPSITYTSALSADQARLVQGVEICLVLYGTELIDMPSGSKYTDCDGKAVDMTTLSGARAKRMHMAFRSTFQLRSQGLL